MTPRARTISDEAWQPYRDDKRFLDVLEGTALAWEALLKFCLPSQPHETPHAGRVMAYRRAVLALAQLPIEFENAESRFMRCRWRAGELEPGASREVHCEHPWTKARTKAVIWELGRCAHVREAPRSDVVQSISDVLKARQDTVLLPRQYGHLGVVHEGRGEGILSRYGPAVRDGTLALYDRRTKSNATLDSLASVEDNISRELHLAVARVAGDEPGWDASLRAAVASATGTLSRTAHLGAIPAGLDWSDAIIGWVQSELGPGVPINPVKGYLSIGPPPGRKTKGALFGHATRDRHCLVFRCDDIEGWVADLDDLDAYAHRDGGLAVPAPPGTDLAQLAGALQSWR